MREILFRGKRKDNGEWIEGFYVKDLFDGYHKILKNNNSELVGYEVILETVGQLRYIDKKGNKLFDGDIFEDEQERYVLLDKDFKLITKCLTNEDFTCSFEELLENYYFGELKVEVIGNIFDNKDLLEEK